MLEIGHAAFDELFHSLECQTNRKKVEIHFGISRTRQLKNVIFALTQRQHICAKECLGVEREREARHYPAPHDISNPTNVSHMLSQQTKSIARKQIMCNIIRRQTATTPVTVKETKKKKQ